MKIRIALALFLFLSLCSCAENTGQSTIANPSEPSTLEEPSNIQALEPYADVRGIDELKTLAIGEYTPEDIRTYWFNEHTIFEGNEELASKIMEEGKVPGLHVPELHAQGITGENVTVAVIDQPLLLDHPEYAGKIEQYHTVVLQTSGEETDGKAYYGTDPWLNDPDNPESEKWRHSFMTTAFIENGYGIRLAWNNPPSLYETTRQVIAEQEYTVSFIEETKKYADDPQVLEAIRLCILERKQEEAEADGGLPGEVFLLTDPVVVDVAVLDLDLESD